ncbi:MAG: serine/threonine protein kinase [Erysipelotrichaceae bacterium]|nr:serine/threonine protein kinase [Erysipelotrichaceae bacterium]
MIDSKYVEENYESVSRFEGNNRVYLARKKSDSSFCVIKYLSVFSEDVFLYLKDHHIKNTPEIYEVFHDKQQLVVIEEYISGRSLNEYLEKKGTLSIEESLLLIRQLCSIVKQFHECEPPIIHRDIKPENIIINGSGTLFLLDVNAAKFFDRSEKHDTYLLGTYGYAPPEQYGFGKAGITSDIYAIGKVLNEMITGSRDGSADGRIRDIIDKCTEMEPGNRYQNVDALLRDLSMKRSVRKDFDKLPGFRSSRMLTKVFSTIGYLLISALFMTSEFEEVDSIGAIWYFRILYYLVFTSVFLFCCNYRNVWRLTGINRIESRIVRILVVACMGFAILAFGLIVGNEICIAIFK